MMGMMGGGGAPAAQAAPAETKAAEKPKEEEKKEKSHYDIELSKFEPTKKIALIKEVRAILGLGLKEAKETKEPKEAKEAREGAEGDDVIHGAGLGCHEDRRLLRGASK